MDCLAFVKTIINCASCSKTILVTIFASINTYIIVYYNISEKKKILYIFRRIWDIFAILPGTFDSEKWPRKIEHIIEDFEKN